MNDEDMKNLARIRYERAEELLKDAEALLDAESFKSANNRAFYACEKAIKSALAVKGLDSASHNGLIKCFNMEFIHNPCEFFSREDMSIIQGMERIRNASDYDDFYVTNKSECEDQVRKAKEIMRKVLNYLKSEGVY